MFRHTLPLLLLLCVGCHSQQSEPAPASQGSGLAAIAVRINSEVLEQGRLYGTFWQKGGVEPLFAHVDLQSLTAPLSSSPLVDLRVELAVFKDGVVPQDSEDYANADKVVFSNMVCLDGEPVYTASAGNQFLLEPTLYRPSHCEEPIVPPPATQSDISVNPVIKVFADGEVIQFAAARGAPNIQVLEDESALPLLTISSSESTATFTISNLTLNAKRPLVAYLYDEACRPEDPDVLPLRIIARFDWSFDGIISNNQYEYSYAMSDSFLETMAAFNRSLVIRIGASEPAARLPLYCATIPTQIWGGSHE